MLACPNKNTVEWKNLENEIGEDKAYLAFMYKGDIPSIQEAKQLLFNNSERGKQINELFESNPELANAVYSALGVIEKSNLKPVSKEIPFNYDNNKELILNGDKTITSRNFKFIPNLQEGGSGLQIIDGISFKITYHGELKHSEVKDKVGIDYSEGEAFAKTTKGKPTEKATEDFIKGIGTKHIYQLEKLGNQITPKQKQQAQQLYSQYLDTIFPDSKVKDIVYHKTPFIFDKFEKPLEERKLNKNNKSDAIFFSFENKGFFRKQEGAKTIRAIINTINNKVTNENIPYATGSKEDIKNILQEDFDSITVNKQGNNKELLVFEPEQIHILSSKADIQGFKEFVNKPAFNKELAQKIQNKLQQLYPEIKLNITNNPVWEQGNNIFNQRENKRKLAIAFKEYLDENSSTFTEKEYLDSLGVVPVSVIHPFDINIDFEEIVDNYEKAISRKSDYIGNLYSWLESGIPQIYKPFENDNSVLIGPMVDNIITVSHFAPSSLRKGVELINEAATSRIPIVMAVPEYQSNQLEKAGFRYVTDIPQFFAGEIVMKKVMINDSVGEAELEKLFEHFNTFNQEDNNQIIGQANIKAMTVLIDAINQKQDTLPHEYAHHYIAWFRDTPIVQEAIKKWGSEEALVQSIGEQVVKQKGEAYNWWNKFVKWIMNQFNSLSSLQKEELTQILTDAFLTREDLANIQNDEKIKPDMLSKENIFDSIDSVARLFLINRNGFFPKGVDLAGLQKYAGRLGYTVHQTSNGGGYYLKDSRGKMYKPKMFSKVENILNEIKEEMLEDGIILQVGDSIVYEGESYTSTEFDEMIINNKLPKSVLPELIDESNEVYQKLMKFLEKIGVSVEMVDFIRNKDGNIINAKGIAKLFSNTIEIVRGVGSVETLGEEAFHFYTKLLESSNRPEAIELLQDMILNIDQYQVYSQVQKDYSELSEYEQRMEAVGKLLSKVANGEKIENLKLNSQAAGWFNRLIEFIKNIFSSPADQRYIEAVNQVMEGDLSLIDLEKSQLRGEMLSKDETPRQKIINQLIENSNQLEKRMVDGKEKYFFKNSVVEYRVHDILNIEKQKRGFFEEQQSQTLEALARRDFGTNTHDDIENIIKRKVESIEKRNVTAKVVKSPAEVYAKLEDYFNEFIDNLLEENPGAKIMTEVKVVNKKGNVAGTIDLLVILPDGSAMIYDYKTTKLKIDKKTGKVLQDIGGMKIEDWNNQIRLYKNILIGNYGITKFRKMRIIPIALEANYNETQKKYIFNDVILGSAIPEKYKLDEELDQIPVAGELSTDERINTVLDKLRSRFDKIKEATAITSQEKEIKAARLSTIAKAIQKFLIRKDSTGIINAGMVEIDRAKSKGLENMTDFELRTLNETLQFYDNIIKNGLFASVKNEKIKEGLKNLAGEIYSLTIQLNNLIETDKLEQLKKDTSIKTIGSAHIPINWFSEKLKTISQSTVPEIRAMYKYIVKAQDNIRVAMGLVREETSKLDKALEDWATAKGIGKFDYLVDKEEGKLIKKFSSEFSKNKKQRIEIEDWRWIKDNTTFDAERYDEIFEEKKKIWTEYYAKEPNGSKKLEWRLKNYAKKYDVRISKDAYLNDKNWYLKPTEQWHSKEYKRLFEAGNEPLLDFYNYYVGKLEEFRDFIPASERGRLLGNTFIPPIKSGTLSTFTSMFGKSSSVNLSELADAITLDKSKEKILADPEQRKIPLHFVKPVDKEKAKEMNYDLTYALNVLSASVYNYKHMAEVEDSIHLLKDVLHNKKQIATNIVGRPAIDSGRVLTQEMNPENNSSLTQFNDFMNYYLYGVTRKDTKWMIPITEKLKDKVEDITGKQVSGIDGTKILDTGRNFYSALALSFNVISGVANLGNGIANFMMEAAKGGMFTKKQAIEGISDLSSNETAWKVMKELDMLGKMEGLRGALNNRKSKWSKIFNMDSLYILQQLGDYAIQNATLLAMMRSHTVKDGKIVKKGKDEKSFIELIEENTDGKLDYKVSNEELQNFKRKAQAISETALGIASRDDVRTAGLSVFGRMLLQFRSWMPKMGYARFGDIAFNSEIERWESGRYNQFFGDVLSSRVLGNITQMLTGMGSSLQKSAEIKYYEMIEKYNPEKDTGIDALINPTTGEFITLEEFTDMYLQNARAMAMEIGAILGIMGIIMAVKPGDDDDKEGWRRVTLKSLYRLQNELKFFYDIDSFLAIVRSPVPIVNLFQKVKSTVGGIVEDTGRVFNLVDGEMETIDNVQKLIPVWAEYYRIRSLFEDKIKN